MPYITEDEVKAGVASFLQTSVGNVPTFWNAIIPKALASAHQDIVSALILRGYSIAQIDQWDRREEFEHDIALFLALSHGAGRHDYNIPAALDRRGMLKTVPLNVADGHQDPSRAPGTIQAGVMDTTNDRFKLDDRY